MSAGTAPSEPERSARARSLGIAVALVVAVGALYGRTRGHAFLGWDDGSYVTENPHVAGGLTAANARWAFTEFHSANWHPLTWLSHQLDVSLFGLDAGAHHLVNAALHALNAVLCFLLFRAATGATAASALVALLFAVHPQRVESVAWVSERKDVLSAAFFFATALAYVRYARGRTLARYGLVVLGLVLGLLAKPMLVTLPLVLLVLDGWPLGAPRGGSVAPGGWRARVLEKLPLLALAGGSALVTVLAQRAGNAVNSVEALPLDARLATAVVSTFAYLRAWIWPSGLAFFYPHPALVAPESFSAVAPGVLLGAALLAGLTALFVALRRRAPALLAGWMWMAVMLLPVIGIVQVGAQSHADRYAYLPLLGPTFGVVFGLRALVAGATVRRALFALGLAVAGAHAVVTVRQIGYWKDTRALCTRALAVTERNHVAHQVLALELQRARQLDAALEHYRATLAIAPWQHDAHGNLGAVYMQLGRREEAIAQYREALRLRPDFLDARLNWGLLFELDGDPAGALAQYDMAVQTRPEASAPRTKRGDALLALGRAAEARDAYRAALEREPDSIDALAGLGAALDELGDEEAALVHLGRALHLAPGHTRALHATAWIHATSRDPRRRDPARALALLATCPDQPAWPHRRTLAAALAAAGRFGEAARAAAEAMVDAPTWLAPRVKAEREAYVAGRALEE